MKNDKELVKAFYKKIDEVLKTEQENNTDKVWGSLHNVMYGFISHSNIYKDTNIGFESKSLYSFIPMVYHLMHTLNSLIISKLKNKHDK